MKTKLPLLAAALLLAVSTASRADDLLDIVLWDGPSAFPSKAAPEPEPPPPTDPEPAPAPAPVYPSRSSYSLRAPAPDTVQLPAALSQPQPPPSDLLDDVLGTPRPSVQPAAQNNTSQEQPAQQTTQTPQAQEPVPLKGAPRPVEPAPTRPGTSSPLETPPSEIKSVKTVPPKIPNPSWSLSARGGVGSDDAIAASAELTKRIGDTPFDLSLRGFFTKLTETRIGTGSYQETYTTYYTYTYRVSRRRTRTRTVPQYHTRTVHYQYEYDVDEQHVGGDLQCIWRPFRSAHFSPYVGVGGRYENVEGPDEEDDGLSLSGRVGVVLSVPGFERLTLKGEFLAGADSKELVGEVGLRLWSHFVLNGFVESFDIDLGRATAFGGGLTFPF